MDPTDSPPPASELLTAGKLARKIQRSRPGTLRALKSLNVEPVIIGGMSFYPASIENALIKSMRSPNRNQQKP